MNKFIISLFSIFLFNCSQSCGDKNKGELRVVASAVPHAEILEKAKDELQAQGIKLKIIVTDDYSMPNRAVAENEADANFFQHEQYFEDQKKQFGYPLLKATAVEIEPMGIYSRKLNSLADLKDGSKIVLPNDPTNEARALFLLEKEGLITLADNKNLSATLINIVRNPKNLKFIEVDAAMVARTLDEVDLAVINTNYALQAKLDIKDALAVEDKDSPYVNILVIRENDKDREDLKALTKALTSENMRAFILDNYKGVIIPTF